MVETTTSYDETQAFNAAIKLAGVWEDTSASIVKRAKAARDLTSIDGVTQKHAAELLAKAIGAARIAMLPDDAKDVAAVDAIAASVKVSASAISQYITALERAEIICETSEGGKLDSALVREFYRAAVSHVKSADIKQIVNTCMSFESVTDRISACVEYLITAQSDAGIARIERIKNKESGDTGTDSDDSADTGTGKGKQIPAGYVSKQDIVAAIESMKEQANDKRAKDLMTQFGFMLLNELGLNKLERK